VVSARGSKSFVGNLLNFRIAVTDGFRDFDELDILDAIVGGGAVVGDWLLFDMKFGFIFGILEGGRI